MPGAFFTADFRSRAGDTEKLPVTRPLCGAGFPWSRGTGDCGNGSGAPAVRRRAGRDPRVRDRKVHAPRTIGISGCPAYRQFRQFRSDQLHFGLEGLTFRGCAGDRGPRLDGFRGAGRHRRAGQCAHRRRGGRRPARRRRPPRRGGCLGGEHRYRRKQPSAQQRRAGLSRVPAHVGAHPCSVRARSHAGGTGLSSPAMPRRTPAAPPGSPPDPQRA